MIKNPFCRCLEPKRIYNPYTREMMTVPCGHCKACVLSKNMRLAFQCDLESESNKYTVFITLTYANRFIPRAQIVDNLSRLFGKDLYDKTTGEFLGELDMSEDKIEALLKKFYLFGDVPYLRKDDLQKFFKRFRYYAKKYTKEKVRYFAVGEYGPEHFRPHYHILLFFNSEALLQVCSEIVCASWQFGRIDCQLSEGKCSSYVAGYVNSTCVVPQIFTLSSTRPFCVHSQKLGQSILEGIRQEIYTQTVGDFIHRGLVVNGKYKEFDLWRSYYAYYFPKCRGFADKSTCERSYSYRLYDTARKAFPGTETCLSLAKEIAMTICIFGVNRETFNFDLFGLLNTDEEFFKLLSYFGDPGCTTDTEEFDRFVTRIYTELLLSKHFLYFVCDRPTVYEINRKIKLIDEFYKELDYLHLTQFFESQQLFYEDDLFGSEDLMSDRFEQTYCPYFYDNVHYSMDTYKHSTLYKTYDSEVCKLFEDRIKHKRLNDKNKIFLDE